jgi:hypothetical protein
MAKKRRTPHVDFFAALKDEIDEEFKRCRIRPTVKQYDNKLNVSFPSGISVNISRHRTRQYVVLVTRVVWQHHQFDTNKADSLDQMMRLLDKLRRSKGDDIIYGRAVLV